MAFVIKDRVKETTTTTGTGTLSLAGAETGFESFSVIGDGNTTFYGISSLGSSEWEVGIGTYSSSGGTLARTTVLSSSNSGSAVNLSAGTKTVCVTQPSEKAVYVSASPGLSGLTLAGAVSGTSGVLSGTVSAATFDGAFIGNITGDVTGNIDGATGSFSTSVSATAVTGATGDFTTSVSATALKGAGLTLTGPVSGTSATFTGIVSASSFAGAITAGAVSATSLVVSGNSTFEGDIIKSTAGRAGRGGGG